MKLFYLGVLVLVVAAAVLLITKNKEIKQPTMTLNPQEQKAYNIAWAELVKHYKDGKRGNAHYVLKHIAKSADSENIYHVTFDPDNLMTDSEVWVTIDISLGIVTKYQEADA